MSEKKTGVKRTGEELSFDSAPATKKSKPNSEAKSESSSSYNRLTRTQFFLAVCELLRQKSNDPYFTVGCCLVRSDTRQLQSIGYNGFLVGENNDPETWKTKATNQSAGKQNAEEAREDYLQHAETNAIHFCTESDLVDTIAYVSCLPCKHCCAKLIQKRVPAVVYNISQEKYLQPTLEAFERAGVNVFSFHDIERKKDQEKVCVQLSGYYNPNKDWEVLFMAIAVLASQRCEQSVEKKEGCVIVTDKKILGYGYSGYPQLMMNKSEEPLINDFPTISAIQNALCFTTNVTGATVYCTNFPTQEGMKELIQRGVSVVKYLHLPEEVRSSSDYNKVNKLAIKNPISLRAYGKGASRVDTDDLNASTIVESAPRFDSLKVEVVPVDEAAANYKSLSLKPDDLTIVVPDLPKAAENGLETIHNWLISPDSIRTVKRTQVREHGVKKEIATEKYVGNSPIKKTL